MAAIGGIAGSKEWRSSHLRTAKLIVRLYRRPRCGPDVAPISVRHLMAQQATLSVQQTKNTGFTNRSRRREEQRAANVTMHDRGRCTPNRPFNGQAMQPKRECRKSGNTLSLKACRWGTRLAGWVPNMPGRPLAQRGQQLQFWCRMQMVATVQLFSSAPPRPAPSGWWWRGWRPAGVGPGEGLVWPGGACRQAVRRQAGTHGVAPASRHWGRRRGRR